MWCFYAFQCLSMALSQGITFLNYFCFAQEGSSHDRGLYARCFEELFDLSNSDSTSTSQFNFCISVFELYNEQVIQHDHSQLWDLSSSICIPITEVEI